MWFRSCCFLLGTILIAANNPANAGSVTSAKVVQTAVAVDRAYRKKPANILTGDSDSDSESEDDKLLGSSLICISDSASGTTDGSSSSSSSGAVRSEIKAQELSSSSSSLVHRPEDGDGDDGMKKKKSKPSARKAANLSGITRVRPSVRLSALPSVALSELVSD